MSLPSRGSPDDINACGVRRVRWMAASPFHRELRENLQQGCKFGGKRGSIEIVPFRFDLASMQEAHGVDGCCPSFLHGFGVPHFATHRQGDRGEAVVKTTRPARHDSQGAAQSLYVLRKYSRLVD